MDSKKIQDLEWLKNYKYKNIIFKKFDASSDKVDWSINFINYYWEICIKRLQELSSAYEFAEKNNLYLIMALCSRSSLETTAIAGSLIIQFEKLAHEGKWKEILPLFKTIHLGYREGVLEKNNLKKIRSENILKHIDIVDKYFQKIWESMKEYTLRDIYNDLSNICHPNFHGMEGLYSSKTNKELQKPFVVAIEVILPIVKILDEHILRNLLANRT